MKEVYGEAIHDVHARRPTVSSFDLGVREIHVWFARLDRPEGVPASLAQVISSDENDRARRFRFRRDANRYLVGRGLLRGLLGRYLGVAPEAIRLSYSRHGKPGLEGRSSSLSFNLSHSDDLAVYAFCLGSEIGVDVERLDAEAASERIAENFFSPGEVAALRALPPDLQPRAFLTCWTRKEAFVKARGDGLLLPLDAFDVTLSPGEAPSLTRTAWAPAEAAAWSLYDLSSGLQEHVGALAVERGEWSLVVNAESTDPLEMIQIGKEYSP